MEKKVKNFKELHEILNEFRGNSLWLFRGHSNKKWDLVPKAGRSPYKKYNDKETFYAWKRQAMIFLKESYDDWDMLTIAQHHGLATRLLDWSFNPLVAAYFAVKEFEDCDAVIYAYLKKSDINVKDEHPFESKGIKKVKPNGLATRVVRQSGIFTIHELPTSSIEDNISKNEELIKIIIDKKYRKKLRAELSYYGIHELSLFPDLDGLANHVNWIMEAQPYGSSNITDELDSINE
ncbi:FRG domain-containing protein [Mammaliicoccus sciuri]|uniref:FRG domain-containing protein n=1 Tax=Mammaliicoccus sciuri TaxID=1296 RepID=UPI000BBEE04F|nr:FRG domain-containing protein [Mammaliicoccus sciuri]PCM41047.1 FRG domain-containing protein [Mammaliicoccus sciuri]UXU78089.1 FRG domain-containing protein [Mammaliicoccus sciuri]